MLKVGIVGLPNVGKSTLFNALAEREAAQTSHRPFTTIKPNKEILSVPDENLDKLVEIIDQNPVLSQELTPGVKKKPAVIEIVDIAGLVKGAAQGEGLGNQFLANIREVDLIIHVLREFENPKVVHVDGKIDPLNDLKTIDLELVLSDLEVVSKAIPEREKKLKRTKGLKKTETAQELEILKKVKKTLDQGKPALTTGLSEEQKKIIGSFNLLTLKPVIFVLNIDEKHLIGKKKIEKNLPQGIVIPVCVQLASELWQLDRHERKEYLKELGVKGTGLGEIIKRAYQTLNLITFYTIKGGEIISAWAVPKGINAQKAAGTIHSQFEKNFVKAEVIGCRDLIKAGSWQGAKEKGLVDLRGRDYSVKNGDVIEFKFSK